MTIVEFFDREMLENIVGTLMLHPKHVVLFGNNKQEMTTFQTRMHKILTKKKIATTIEVVEVDTKNYSAIIRVLNQLIHAYPDCVFDLTGGEPMILVAMGAVSAERDVPLHAINPENSVVKTILHGNQEQKKTQHVALTVYESVLLYGGTISSGFPETKKSFSLLYNELNRDITALWYILRKNCGNWNTAIDTMSSWLNSIESKKNALTFTIPQDFFLDSQHNSHKVLCTNTMLKQLTEKKIIIPQRTDGNSCYTFKNKQMRYALSKSGTVLELYTLLCVFSTKRDNGTPLITDAISGALIDWPQTNDNQNDVKNEIDVLATAGVIPVFISCKNGNVNSDELYKLNTVAERFGGKYARKILVMTHAYVRRSFLRRAAAMDIKVIRGVHEMSRETFIKKLQDSIIQKPVLDE